MAPKTNPLGNPENVLLSDLATTRATLAKQQNLYTESQKKTGRLVKIEMCITDWNVRTQKIVHDQALIELAQSMQDQGQFHPIEVRPKGLQFIVTKGHRRLEAAKLNKWEDIWAVIAERGEDEILSHQIHENIQRSELPDTDIYQAICTNATAKNIDYLEAAKGLGISVTRARKIQDGATKRNEILTAIEGITEEDHRSQLKAGLDSLSNGQLSNKKINSVAELKSEIGITNEEDPGRSDTSTVEESANTPETPAINATITISIFIKNNLITTKIDAGDSSGEPFIKALIKNVKKQIPLSLA